MTKKKQETQNAKILQKNVNNIVDDFMLKQQT